MPKKLSPQARFQYCALSSAIVSDEAIDRGILTSQNVTPLLFFFIAVGNNEVAQHWLMPKQEVLSVGRWLQIVGWLSDQFIFVEPKKSQIADYLISSDCLPRDFNRHSICNAMSKPIPFTMASILKKEFKKVFILTKK